MNTDDPAGDPAAAAHALLDSARRKLEGWSERHNVREIVELAEKFARAAARIRALENCSPITHSDLVRFDHGQVRGECDQACLHVNAAVAKANLSQLLRSALNGDDVVICRANRPVARLVPYERALAPSPPARSANELCPPDQRDWFKPFEDLWDGT